MGDALGGHGNGEREDVEADMEVCNLLLLRCGGAGRPLGRGGTEDGKGREVI